MRLIHFLPLLTFTALIGHVAFGVYESYAEDKTRHAPYFKGEYYRETQAGNYLASRYAQNNQDWKKASEYVDKLISLDPENSDLLQKSMLLAMGSGEYNQAFAAARKVLNQSPDNIWGMLFISVEALSNQDYTHARKLLSSMPQESITGFIRPVVEIWIKAFEGKLETKVPLDNDIARYHTVLAAHYLGKTKDLKEEVIADIPAMGIDVKDKERIADIFFMAGNKKRALDLYIALQASQPMSDGLDKKIEALQNNQSIEPLLDYSPIESASAGIARSFYDISRILFREYNDESAHIFSQLALCLSPSMTEAKILLAHIQTRHGRYSDAIAYYESIAQDDPIYLPIQHQAAEILIEMNRRDDAVALLNRLIEKHNDVEALIQLADLYRRTDQYEESLKTYDKVFNHFKGSIPDEYWGIFYARGMVYEQSGQWDLAENDLRKALSYKPEHPYLLNYLGYSMADRNHNLEEALSMIAKAVELRPADGNIVDSLGWVYYRMGKFNEAIGPLEKAVELLPYDPTINDHLGDAYWQTGRKTEAEYQWKRALNHAEDKDMIAQIEQKLANGLAKLEPHTPVQKEASSTDVLPAN